MAGPYPILGSVSSAWQSGESASRLFRQEQILPSAYSELLQLASVLEFSSAGSGAAPAVNSCMFNVLYRYSEWGFFLVCSSAFSFCGFNLCLETLLYKLTSHSLGFPWILW